MVLLCTASVITGRSKDVGTTPAFTLPAIVAHERIVVIVPQKGIAFPVLPILITPWIHSMLVKVIIIILISCPITPGGIAGIKTHTAFASVLPHGIGTILVVTPTGSIAILFRGITL